MKLTFENLLTSDSLKHLNSIPYNNDFIHVFELSELPSEYSYFGYIIPKGQWFVRKLIDDNYSPKIIPNCLFIRSSNNFLAIDAFLYWKAYSYIPKCMAIYNNKILGFKMLSNDIVENFKRTNSLTTISSFEDYYELNHVWSDMQSECYCHIPITVKQKFKSFAVNVVVEVNEKNGEIKKTSKLNYFLNHKKF